MRGGLNGLVFVAPAALVGELLADDDGRLRGVASILIVVVQLLGFAFSGYAARRIDPRTPASVTACAGLVCWAILQSVGVVTTLVRGEDLRPLTWVATALLAAVTAAIGGMLTRVERAPNRTVGR